jgi:hypothetical protein
VRISSCQPLAQRGQPRQLVDVFVGIDRLAVRHVGAHDAHAVDGGGQDALLLVLEARVVLHHVGDRQLRQDRHAVVGFLAAEGDLVAGGVDLGHREFVVGELGLLQAEHVDRVSSSHCSRWGRRTFSELTFQVAIFIFPDRWYYFDKVSIKLG